MRLDLFTIGYTKTTAEHFFDRLARAGVQRLIDIRISNKSQLSGFAKAPDLAFFLGRLVNIAYRFEPLLAPPLETMKAYREGTLTWQDYPKEYLTLLAERQVDSKLEPETFDKACLLCSEAKPDTCHRRLAAEYLQQHLLAP